MERTRSTWNLGDKILSFVRKNEVLNQKLLLLMVKYKSNLDSDVEIRAKQPFLASSKILRRS